MTKTVEFIHPNWSTTGVTVVELIEWAIQNDIPKDAYIQYAGCGSHRIEFEWDRGVDEGTAEDNFYTMRMPPKLEDDEYWVKVNE